MSICPQTLASCLTMFFLFPFADFSVFYLVPFSISRLGQDAALSRACESSPNTTNTSGVRGGGGGTFAASSSAEVASPKVEEDSAVQVFL